jgi:hypothetical protein
VVSGQDGGLAEVGRRGCPGQAGASLPSVLPGRPRLARSAPGCTPCRGEHDLTRPPRDLGEGDPGGGRAGPGSAASSMGWRLQCCTASNGCLGKGRGGSGDLGPCRAGLTPAEPPHSSANVKTTQGKGNLEGNRRGPGTGGRPRGRSRRTPDAGKPEEGERRRRILRANGKPEESPQGKPEAVR